MKNSATECPYIGSHRKVFPCPLGINLAAALAAPPKRPCQRSSLHQSSQRHPKPMKAIAVIASFGTHVADGSM